MLCRFFQSVGDNVQCLDERKTRPSQSFVFLSHSKPSRKALFKIFPFIVLEIPWLRRVSFGKPVVPPEKKRKASVDLL